MLLNHPGRAFHRHPAADAFRTGRPNHRRQPARRPGVQVRDSNGTGGSDISLNVGVRGLIFASFSALPILMDGVRWRSRLYASRSCRWPHLSIGNLQSVDVVRGGGAVRTGRRTSAA
ncbi:TonB-dependent receptor plug domain-containing protein [Serratia ureilytica]